MQKRPREIAVGRQRLLTGDVLDRLRTLPNASVGVVVTSPPYNIGVLYNAHADRLPRTDYLGWMREIATELRRVLTPAGSLFLNIGNTSSDGWIAYDVAAQFRDAFVLQNTITWVKSISIGDDSFGHFKPVTSQRFLNNAHETIFHFTPTGHVAIDRLGVGVPFKDKSNIARWGHARDRRCAGNVWFIPYDTVRSKAQKYDHPAGFPVALPERCIRLHGDPEATVLDPFMGAGTTLIAAEKLGQRGIGIDIDPVYVRAAAGRLAALEPDSRSTARPSASRSAPVPGRARRLHDR